MTSSLRYGLTITTLTPLHVGSGQRLREGYDFIAHGEHVWIADLARLYEAMLAEAMSRAAASEPPASAMAAALARAGLAVGATPAAATDPLAAAATMSRMTLAEYESKGWLRAEHFAAGRGLFRYSLPGRTSTANKEGELHEQIKDVFGRPYLPGSSLKGALRSVFMRTLAAADSRPPVIAQASAKFAARDMERRYFVAAVAPPSRSPNYDVWRAVQIADSAPFAAGALALAQVYVRRFSTRSPGPGEGDIPIDVEVIRPGEQTTATLAIDPWLFEDRRAAQRLQFQPELLGMLRSTLCQTANEDAARLIEAELAFLAAAAPGAVALRARMEQLRATVANAAPGELFIRSGRATGWLGKTLGRVLLERLPAQEFEAAVQRYGLGRGRWRQDRPLPATRQLASLPGDPDAPMGWLRIVLEEKQ